MVDVGAKSFHVQTHLVIRGFLLAVFPHLHRIGRIFFIVKQITHPESKIAKEALDIVIQNIYETMWMAAMG